MNDFSVLVGLNKQLGINHSIQEARMIFSWDNRMPEDQWYEYFTTLKNESKPL